MKLSQKGENWLRQMKFTDKQIEHIKNTAKKAEFTITVSNYSGAKEVLKLTHKQAVNLFGNEVCLTLLAQMCLDGLTKAAIKNIEQKDFDYIIPGRLTIDGKIVKLDTDHAIDQNT